MVGSSKGIIYVIGYSRNKGIQKVIIGGNRVVRLIQGKDKIISVSSRTMVLRWNERIDEYESEYIGMEKIREVEEMEDGDYLMVVDNQVILSSFQSNSKFICRSLLSSHQLSPFLSNHSLFQPH
jgi:hypothetical protein